MSSYVRNKLNKSLLLLLLVVAVVALVIVNVAAAAVVPSSQLPTYASLHKQILSPVVPVQIIH